MLDPRLLHRCESSAHITAADALPACILLIQAITGFKFAVTSKLLRSCHTRYRLKDTVVPAFRLWVGAHIQAASALLKGAPLAQVARGWPAARAALPEQAPRLIQPPPESLQLGCRLIVEQRPSLVCRARGVHGAHTFYQPSSPNSVDCCPCCPPSELCLAHTSVKTMVYAIALWVMPLPQSKLGLHGLRQAGHMQA